jgi:hypothetical protein
MGSVERRTMRLNRPGFVVMSSRVWVLLGNLGVGIVVEAEEVF